MLLTFLKNHALSLFLTVVIIALSLCPIGRIELAEGVPLADKWTHMVMYAALSLALAWEYHRNHVRQAQCKHTHIVWLRFLSIVLLLPIVLGGVMELAQAYCTNYRSGEWLDLVADAIGAAVATALAAVLFKSLRV